uniref:AlNc14C432G11594 protein n=1 Tax=Albugo laibachii Nc14 TaxID=890382 RepID=F0WZK3_9STRA|nr:AlNc14C432G11594 [Albugo laibachii Nc14]|eukprot:CCA26927.1 AlNc14C432G11594 [Albugo laibachii Nc14]
MARGQGASGRDANDVQIYGSSTAWWNSAMTIEWMRYNFGDRTTATEPILLMLGSFYGHWTDEIQAYDAMCNVQLKAVPPKLTWRCQPADVTWIKPLKDKLCANWVENLRDQPASLNRGSAGPNLRPIQFGYNLSQGLSYNFSSVPSILLSYENFNRDVTWPSFRMTLIICATPQE